MPKQSARAIPNLRLRLERELRNWTQEEVAKKVGTTSFNVSRWERGITFPNFYFRQKLCATFGMSPAELGLIQEGNEEWSTQVVEYVSLAQNLDTPLPGFFDPAIPPALLGAYSLVGREELLEDLKQRLHTTSSLALAALNGLPGVGKTALAVELANDDDVLEYFRDGVLWVGLGRAPDVVEQLARWGGLLQIAPGEMAQLNSIESWAKAIRAAIGMRRMLLVIDDAWQAKDALAFKVGGPNCAHLLTTRFPEIAFHFAGESTIVVHELNEEESITLLEQLVPEIVVSELDEVRKLVRLVGGLPLALTLMGKYLLAHIHLPGPSHRLHAALQRLQRAEVRLQLAQPQMHLAAHPSLPEDTPISLEAVISVSDQHLDAKARYTLRALSIFPPKPNTFSEEAALAVTALPVEVLDTLIDAGLLEGAVQGRYTLHQTISDYARKHLLDYTVEKRMVEFFVSYVQVHEMHYELLELEIGNVLAALQIAFERGMHTELEEGVIAFSHFLQTRALYSQAELLLKRAEQFLRSSDKAECIVPLTKILLNLGRVAEKQGDYIQVEAYYEEALNLARESGDQEVLSAILTNMGGAAVRRGNYKRAEELLQEGLILTRQLGHNERTGTLLENLGAAAFFQGNYPQAEAYWQEGLELVRQINHRERIGTLLENLGSIAVNRGDYAQAEAFYQEGMNLAREIGQPARICSIYANLSEIALRRGDYTRVIAYSEEGLSLARQIGNTELISCLLIGLGQAATGLENYTQARVYLEEGLDLARQVGHRWLISYALIAWGECYLKLRQLDLAFSNFSDALASAQDVNPELAAISEFGLAQVIAARGNYAEARRQGEESLALFRSINHEQGNKVARWLETLPED